MGISGGDKSSGPGQTGREGVALLPGSVNHSHRGGGAVITACQRQSATSAERPCALGLSSLLCAHRRGLPSRTSCDWTITTLSAE